MQINIDYFIESNNRYSVDEDEEDKIILLEKIMSDEDNINQVLFEVLREYKGLVQTVLNNKKVFNYSLEEIDSLMKQLLEAPKA
jgi:predicted patatin/cPLA2 family phospholipase